MQDLEFRQFIERVKLRTPIEVVVGERVAALRSRGSLFWACCPFHQERTPSFAVDPRRGTWRCFGACGEGGDVLSFVERFDGLTFLEALRLLARQCGEELPERATRGRAQGTEAALEARLELLAWAAEIYRQAWSGPEGRGARSYMERRGLSNAVLDAFGIGWASENGLALLRAAERDKKPIDWLAEAGLLRRNDAGRTYDFFRGRVLIPIRDRLGRVVGFGGRLLGTEGDTTGPKYLNTPETPYFHKGRLIFGLDLAARAIRSSHRLLVVEGYTDVMAAHQAGWQETVAVLGTATTEDHAALIRRSGARAVVLVFDGDEAGRKATMRALHGLLPLPLELRVAVLPEDRDPGDLLIEPEGSALFRAAVEGARDWFDWALSGLDEKRGSELTLAVEERFKLLARLDRPIDRSARLGEMARHLRLPDADVREHWARFEREQSRTPQPALPRPSVPAAHQKPPRGSQRAYADLLGALLVDNSLLSLYAHLFEACPHADLARLFRALHELYQADESGQAIDAARLMAHLGADPLRDAVVALEARAVEAESAAILARDSAEWLERAHLRTQLAALRTELHQNTSDEVADLARLEQLHEALRRSDGRRSGRALSPSMTHEETPSVSSPTP